MGGGGRAAVWQLLGLVNRGIQLEPAARAVVDGCRQDRRRSAALASEGLRVREAYRALAAAARQLGPCAPEAADAIAVLEHHLHLLTVALELAYRPPSEATERQRRRLDGLGSCAGRLEVLRDRIAADAGGDPLDTLVS
jgi:hypothetical protein